MAPVMTVHPLHAGDGYSYLTRQVATADRQKGRGQDITDYYTAEGAPPGQWHGLGADALGVGGEVSEAQMKALFGEGLHPNADRMMEEALAEGRTVEQATAAARLGSRFYNYTAKETPIRALLGEKITAFRTENRHSPDPAERNTLRMDAAAEAFTKTHDREGSEEELIEALAAEKRGIRQPVAGYDLVFTPQKSVSLLWGLGSAEVRDTVARVHAQAVTETLEWVQTEAGKTRRGRNGVRQIDTDGLTIARFDHFDNRTGDPNLHTHAAVSNKVLGSDGRWSALDGRVLFSLGVAASNRYNAILVDHLRRELGVRFEERSHGRGKQMVKEVAGISDTMIADFSRRADIVARTEELTAEYRTQYGRTPSKTTQIKLAQQAVLDTRDAKPVPRSLAAMRTDWAERATGYTRNRTPEEFIDHLIRTHRDPTVLRDFDPQEVALAAGVAFHARRDQTIGPVIDRELDRCVFATPADREQGRRQVQTLLGDRSADGFGDRIAEAITAQARTVYDQDRIATEVLDTVSRRRATWTEANLRTVAEDAVSRCTFPTAAEQRAAVEAVVDQARDRGSLLLSVDPDQPPSALSRRDGESVYTVHGAKRYTSEAVLAAEERLLVAGHTPTTEFVTTAAVDTAIAAAEKASGRELNDGQRAIATHLATSGQLVAVAIGPAGTGKTTAMHAVCQAWSDDGRQILALAPSAVAAQVLGDELGVPGRTVTSVLTAARHGANTGITPGAMLLVDEAGMTATADLDNLLTLAREHGAVLRLIGDPYQLGAVESGGALKLLAHDTSAPELVDVVRFTNPAEAEASLSVRRGDAAGSWEFYQGNHRVSAGMVDELREKILTNHLADTETGKSSLMLAATVADVTALNNAAQTAHAHSGIVDITGTRTVLSDGLSAHAGDVVVTRRNNPRLKVAGGRRDGSGVSNGHLWKVKSVHEDGSLTVTGRDHRGRVHLPKDYVDEHVELGYAATIHRAQGMTVDRCHTLMNATLGRSLAYVGLTRGHEDNQIYLATDQPPDPDLDHAPDAVVTGRQVFGSILARGDANVTATETLRAEMARIDDPDRLRGMYADVTGELAENRARHLLDRALPATLYATAQESPHFGDLLRTVAVADQHGLNTQSMVNDISSRGDQHIAGESLLAARDVGAVLRSRADTWIAAHTPNDPDQEKRPGGFRALRDLPERGDKLAPVPPRHPGMDTALADYADTLAARITTLGTETVPPAEKSPVVRPAETEKHPTEEPAPDNERDTRRQRAGTDTREGAEDAEVTQGSVQTRTRPEPVAEEHATEQPGWLRPDSDRATARVDAPPEPAQREAPTQLDDDEQQAYLAAVAADEPPDEEPPVPDVVSTRAATARADEPGPEVAAPRGAAAQEDVAGTVTADRDQPGRAPQPEDGGETRQRPQTPSESAAAPERARRLMAEPDTKQPASKTSGARAREEALREFMAKGPTKAPSAEVGPPPEETAMDRIRARAARKEAERRAEQRAEDAHREDPGRQQDQGRGPHL